MVEGTMVLGSPDEMNWSMAIWAVASCIATRSDRREGSRGARKHWANFNKNSFDVPCGIGSAPGRSLR